jgi:hypothetical protein
MPASSAGRRRGVIASQGTRGDNQRRLRLQPEAIERVQVGRPERAGVGDVAQQPAAEARAARRGHELQVKSARHGVRRPQRRGALEAPGAQLCGGGGGGVDDGVAERVDVRDARQPEPTHDAAARVHRDQLHARQLRLHARPRAHGIRERRTPRLGNRRGVVDDMAAAVELLQPAVRQHRPTRERCLEGGAERERWRRPHGWAAEPHSAALHLAESRAPGGGNLVRKRMGHFFPGVVRSPLQISLTWCGKEREIWNTRPHDTRVPVSTQGATLRSVRPRGSK